MRGGGINRAPRRKARARPCNYQHAEDAADHAYDCRPDAATTARILITRDGPPMRISLPSFIGRGGGGGGKLLLLFPRSPLQQQQHPFYSLLEVLFLWVIITPLKLGFFAVVQLFLEAGREKS